MTLIRWLSYMNLTCRGCIYCRCICTPQVNFLGEGFQQLEPYKETETCDQMHCHAPFAGGTKYWRFTLWQVRRPEQLLQQSGTVVISTDTLLSCTDSQGHSPTSTGNFVCGSLAGTSSGLRVHCIQDKLTREPVTDKVTCSRSLPPLLALAVTCRLSKHHPWSEAQQDRSLTWHAFMLFKQHLSFSNNW